MSENIRTLTHLKDLDLNDIKGYETTFYSIALEAWRRGINVKFINNNRAKAVVSYELNYKGKSHLFVSSRGDLTSRETMAICRNKFKAKQYLRAANVPTPEGELFNENTDDQEIINYAIQKGFPVVIKPVDGQGGRGVISNIQNEKEFQEALKYVRYELNYKKIIVEDYFPGKDLRVYVVDGEVIAITKRIPANVVGDGKSSIEKLIREKNKMRKKNPVLTSSLIKINSELITQLEYQNLNLKSVPNKNKRIYLQSKNNVSAGGDPIDVTDNISDEIKKIAIEAVEAIPGLVNAGVDLMVDLERNKATVLEINTQASIRTHLFPLEGEPRDIPKKIIDYYFPETKGIKINQKIYFEFSNVWKLFRSGKVQEFKLPTISPNMTQMKFTVIGKVQFANYATWVRRQARNYNLHGYFKHKRKNAAEIVVMGEHESLNIFKEIIKTQDSKLSKVTEVIEMKCSEPIKAGFRVLTPELDRQLIDGYYPKRIEGLSKLRRQQSIKDNSKQKTQDNKYKEQLEKVLNSNSWKITSPLRKFSNLARKIKRKIVG